MAQLTISEVARRVGLRPSAIRYYERVKVMPPPPRQSGQRRYDDAAVYHLAVLRRAQEVGFTLNEVRLLFSGFRKSTPVSERWRKIAETKQAELDAQIGRIQSMKAVLLKLQSNCRCETLSECGEGLYRNGFAGEGP